MIKINKRLISVGIILSITLIVLLSSCTGNPNLSSKDGYYYINRIDSVFFVDYNSIFLSNSDNKKIWLLSKKLLNRDTIFNSLEKYEQLNEDAVIKLDLVKNDTLKIMKSTYRFKDTHDRFVYDFSDNSIAWDTDTIKHVVYFSPQVLDVYILKQK
ncbi:MAG: hypothetical protein PHN88_08055 [Ignavibacteria bacterium]|nr:hypothetical protein [Ignavibacteria bacterium]